MADRVSLTKVVQTDRFSTDEELIKDHKTINALISRYANDSKDWDSRLPKHLNENISYAEAKRIINDLDERPHKPPVRIVIEIRRYREVTVTIVYSSSYDVTLASTHKLGFAESFKQLDSESSILMNVFGIVFGVVLMNPVGVAPNSVGLSNSMYDLLSNSKAVKRYFKNQKNKYNYNRLLTSSSQTEKQSSQTEEWSCRVS